MAIDIESPGANEADLAAALNAITKTVTIVDVTTGASQVDIDLADYGNWITLAVRVTSGGTAGVEVLNFIGPFDELGDTSVGRTLNVVFAHQTDPSDVINIFANDDWTITCLDNLGNSIGDFGAATFNQEGNNIVFGFNGDVIPHWRWNCLYGNWDSPTFIANKRSPMPSGGTFGYMPLSDGSGDADWYPGPIIPFPLMSVATVSSLNTFYPAGSYPRSMAIVQDANSPVVGEVVSGGGSSTCVVITNTGATDWVVMFVLP